MVANPIYRDIGYHHKNYFTEQALQIGLYPSILSCIESSCTLDAIYYIFLFEIGEGCVPYDKDIGSCAIILWEDYYL